MLTLLAHVGDVEAVDRSGVVRLTAPGRIEGRLVERDRAVAACDDSRLERREVRVAQVEQFGQ